MFDPSIGQWFQEDPIDFDAGDPNLRRYANNNPVNFCDQTGLQTKEQGADQVEARPVTFYTWATLMKGGPGEGYYKKIAANWKATYAIDVTDQSFLNEWGNSSCFYSVVARKDGKIRGDFLSLVRFTAKLNDQQWDKVGIVQNVQQFEITKTITGGTTVRPIPGGEYFEGWTINRNGFALIPDSHGAGQIILDPKTEKMKSVRIDFVVSVGTIDGDPITGKLRKPDPKSTTIAGFFVEARGNDVREGRVQAKG